MVTCGSQRSMGWSALMVFDSTVFDKSNTQGIYSNRFATLQIETDGTLLAGTERRVHLTSYRDGTFRSYTAAEGLPGNNIVEFGRRQGRADLCRDQPRQILFSRRKVSTSG